MKPFRNCSHYGGGLRRPLAGQGTVVLITASCSFWMSISAETCRVILGPSGKIGSQDNRPCGAAGTVPSNGILQKALPFWESSLGIQGVPHKKPAGQGRPTWGLRLRTSSPLVCSLLGRELHTG